MARNQSKAEHLVRNRSLVAYNNPLSPITEQYRGIRSNLQFMYTDPKMRLMMVTSPGNGEGKTTTAVNLAISMALRGDRVLLVDANLRKPLLHIIFNTPNSIGLTNVLAGHSITGDAIHATDIGRLEVLTSGPLMNHSTELLGSKTMKQILQMLKEKYDVVLIDGPPVLKVTDTAIIANQCDGAILVVKRGKTQKDALLEAQKILVLAKTKILGVVMNHTKA